MTSSHKTISLREETDINPENEDTSVTNVTSVRNSAQLLGPAIIEALHFQPDTASGQEMKGYISTLQALLGKTVQLLKEQDCLCANLERQNASLVLQKNSLQDIVLVVQNLIKTQMSEVAYLHEQLNCLHGKYDFERQRHFSVLDSTTGISRESVSPQMEQTVFVEAGPSFDVLKEEEDKLQFVLQSNEYVKDLAAKLLSEMGVGGLTQIQ